MVLLENASNSDAVPSAKPHGSFLLIPSPNGSMLIKSIAVRDIVMPLDNGNVICKDELPEIQEKVNAIFGQVGFYDVAKVFEKTFNRNSRLAPRYTKCIFL